MTFNIQIFFMNFLNEAALLNLTDDELIRVLDYNRQYSKVIDELCKRLEKNIKDNDVNINPKVECPVCLASLKVEIDTNNNIFDIKVDKDN